jgi:exodeoxyribonuclease-3
MKSTLFHPGSSRNKRKMAPFTIATYNVNSIRSRLHILIPWIEANRPDVLCLQETKVDDARFPAGDFAALGYRTAFRGGKQYNGVALLSLREPRSVAFGLDDGGPRDEDRLVRAEFGGVTVINTYVPQGREMGTTYFTYKLEWFQRFREYLARHLSPEKSIAWVGDLNVAPEPIDLHDPKHNLKHVCFAPEVREAFLGVAGWGLLDVFRKHHPGEAKQYSFFDYRMPKAVERKLGWRVDHILATAPLAATSVRCDIDLEPRMAEKPSDHTVVMAEFNR